MDSTQEEKLIQSGIEKTKQLHEILSAKKFNFDQFIDLIVKRSNNFERQIMVDEYKTQFSEDIFAIIEKKFKDELREILTFLFYNPYELDARIINISLRGKKRDEKAVIEIICSRPFWYLETVNQEYECLYNISIKED